MMLRFIVPDHDLNLELTEYGSPVSGTPVAIMEPTNLLACARSFKCANDHMLLEVT